MSQIAPKEDEGKLCSSSNTTSTTFQFLLVSDLNAQFDFKYLSETAEAK